MEREALREAIEQERRREVFEGRDRLIALGKKAMAQRDLGMSIADIANAHGRSNGYISKAINAWRQHEGITPRTRSRSR